MDNNSKNTCLCIGIGNFNIRLWSKSDVNIGIDFGYAPFTVSEIESNDFTEIEIIPSIPDTIKSEDTLVFETNDDTKKLWHVCSTSDGYKIIVYSPIRPNEIQFAE